VYVISGKTSRMAGDMAVKPEPRALSSEPIDAAGGTHPHCPLAVFEQVIHSIVAQAG
jgi:hypothetical protein